MARYVLVVDDDPDWQTVLTMLLKSMDLDTQVASDGVEALDRLRDEQSELPALVLLDLMMPNMSGFEVLSWMQRNLDTRHIPVIVVTGDTIEHTDLLMLPGVTKVIHKEKLNLKQLGNLISNTIGLGN